MRKVENQTTNRNSLYCAIFGHNFQVSKNITYHVKEYKCCNCKKEMTTNSNGDLTELTPKFKEINSVLERIHSNKLIRLSRQRINYPQFKMTS